MLTTSTLIIALAATVSGVLVDADDFIVEPDADLTCTRMFKEGVFLDNNIYRNPHPLFGSGRPREGEQPDSFDLTPSDQMVEGLCANKTHQCLNNREILTMKHWYQRGKRQMEFAHQKIQELIFTLSDIGGPVFIQRIIKGVDFVAAEGLAARAQDIFNSRIKASQDLEKAVRKMLVYYSGFPCQVFNKGSVFLAPGGGSQKIIERAVINLNVVNLSELFSVINSLLRFRIWTRKFYKLLRDVSPAIGEISKEIESDDFEMPKIRDIFNKVNACKVKLASSLLQEHAQECLTFIDPDVFLHSTNWLGSDFARTIIMTHHLQRLFGQPTEEITKILPKITLENIFKKINFFAPSLGRNLMTVNLVYRKDSDIFPGMIMKSNTLNPLVHTLSTEG